MNTGMGRQPLLAIPSEFEAELRPREQEPNMSVWFITGAGRGLGLDIAKAALAAGHKGVATGRNTEKVARAVAIRIWLRGNESTS
jgi:hypothetical protein